MKIPFSLPGPLRRPPGCPAGRRCRRCGSPAFLRCCRHGGHRPPGYRPCPCHRGNCRNCHSGNGRDRAASHHSRHDRDPNRGHGVAQTADAGRTYLDETLFIGDSNTARYLMYADETARRSQSLNNNIGVVSMGAGAITTLPCEKFKGRPKCTPFPEAVAMLKPKRIIICYGTNNLGGSSTDATVSFPPI